MPIYRNNKNYGTRVVFGSEPPTPPTPPTPTDNYFYVEDASGSDNTLTITQYGTYDIEVFRSTNQTNWVSMGTTTRGTPLMATVPANGRLYLKAVADKWYQNRISVSSSYNIGGNIMSLLYGDNYTGAIFTNLNEYAFSYLFYSSTNLLNVKNLVLPENVVTACYGIMFNSCSSLITAPTLPATTLANECYNAMFGWCTSLETAPALPATTLANQCYRGMFYECTSLTETPVLPATTLVPNCYREMFSNCLSLSTVTTYAQDISASNCLSEWLGWVSQTGDFYNLGGATYSSGNSGIPTGWTEHTSL